MQLLPEDQPIVAARVSAEEIKIELASALYSRGRLTLGQAAQLASVSHWQMQQALAVRGIIASYDEAELEADRRQLNRLA